VDLPGLQVPGSLLRAGRRLPLVTASRCEDAIVISLGSFVLGTPDPARLAAFYRELLGWQTVSGDAEFIRLRDPARERPGLSFQLEPDHVAPTWPSGTGTQQMQAHLDLLVDDLDAETKCAVALGATREAHQPTEGVVVMRDPDGHPFCLFLPGA
jgi:catechol 2,3-dioxygenase-like lactoylglutathione lyase family enzyme